MRGILILLGGCLLVWLAFALSRPMSTAPETEGATNGLLSRPSGVLAQELPVNSDEDRPAAEEEAERTGPPLPRPQPVLEELPEAPGGNHPEAVEDPPEEPELQAPESAGPGSELGQGASGEPDERPMTVPIREGEDDSTFEFPSTGAALEELARFLLEGVAEGNAEQLQLFVNEGAGRELPLDTRRLVSSFWQALNGDERGARAGLDEIGESEHVTQEQLETLRIALDVEGSGTVPAAWGLRDPLVTSMRLALLLRRAEANARERRYPAAARDYSLLLLDALQVSWALSRDVLHGWGTALNTVQDHHRFDPSGDWPSIDHVVQRGQSLISIRKAVMQDHPEMLFCTGMIESANTIGKYLQENQVLRIPTDRPEVLVDLDARMLLYLQGDEVLRAYRVGIGMDGHETPTGVFEVGEKQQEPSWLPLGAPQVPYGHPDNPLGTRWLAWFQNGAKTSYGIHGTRDPDGVGGRVSQGCIRMRNKDVEELYQLVPIRSRVRVQP